MNTGRSCLRRWGGQSSRCFSSKRAVRRIVGFVSIVALLTLTGCQDEATTNPPLDSSSKEPATIPRGPAPTYADVAARYNARASKLDKLRSPVSLIIRSFDENGMENEDQVEGNLQVIPPRNVALRVDKVGQMLYYLGSNDDYFWSLEMSDPKVARIGTHTGAAAYSVKDLGLPVHPLDVIELLGITPLPPASPSDDGVGGGRVAWSADGRTILISLHGRWSTRRLRLDPQTLEPVRIELLDKQGDEVVTCDLSQYIPVTVRADVTDAPRMASRLVMTQQKTQGSIRLNAVAPENPGDRMKTAPFDLKKLLEAYGVKRVIDLDRVGAASEAPRNTNAPPARPNAPAEKATGQPPQSSAGQSGSQTSAGPPVVKR